MVIEAEFVASKVATQEMNAKISYVIDRNTSQFTVQVSAGGLLSAFGHNPTIAIRDFSGEAQADPGDLSHASLKVVIKAQSFAVRDDISDKDRREIERIMQEEILESAAYPQIVYECSDIAVSNAGQGYTVTLNGNLTLHGVTRPQTVKAQVAVMGDTLRAFGNFSILQTHYGLKLVTVAGGALKVKDELRFSFTTLARKKE